MTDYPIKVAEQLENFYSKNYLEGCLSTKKNDKNLLSCLSYKIGYKSVIIEDQNRNLCKLDYEIDPDLYENYYNVIFAIKMLYAPIKDQASAGKITAIKKSNIFYKNDTIKGWSGSPVLRKDNNRVIGLHKSGLINNNINIGTLIKYILMNMNKIEEIIYEEDWEICKKSKKKIYCFNKEKKKCLIFFVFIVIVIIFFIIFFFLHYIFFSS